MGKHKTQSELQQILRDWLEFTADNLADAWWWGDEDNPPYNELEPLIEKTRKALDVRTKDTI